MIKGIGIDLLEISRLEEKVRRNERFVKRILTTRELDLLNQCSSRKRKMEFSAGRFAAKEAYAKARGTGLGQDLSFLDIEVIPDEKGKPVVYVKGNREKNTFLSISHSEQFVIAEVIIQEG
ncbi:holo-ACP synthase [Salirhabdus salicampi]|uniref:holo-ACP synthase n=1 Tax=Salirhabdus salicampi TaxID=476102 RepID=UPI0020C353CC|nr:holo-ACP synthase [Salirhabdus salicampi]MCP8618094.1 holo-ACP synthase [Salirhabdus salicampi]